jgi:hypothetical protein
VGSLLNTKPCAKIDTLGTIYCITVGRMAENRDGVWKEHEQYLVSKYTERKGENSRKEKLKKHEKNTEWLPRIYVCKEKS